MPPTSAKHALTISNVSGRKGLVNIISLYILLLMFFLESANSSFLLVYSPPSLLSSSIFHYEDLLDSPLIKLHKPKPTIFLENIEELTSRKLYNVLKGPFIKIFFTSRTASLRLVHRHLSFILRLPP